MRTRAWGRMCVGALQRPQAVDLRPRNLAAGAEEDRAALSGRPRKANAGQYEIVLHQGQYATVMPQPYPARDRTPASPMQIPAAVVFANDRRARINCRSCHRPNRRYPR